MKSESSMKKLEHHTDILSDALKTEDVYLFGGCVLDTFVDPETDLRDVDVALVGHREVVHDLVKKLTAAEFNIIEPHRRYRINMDTPVSMIFASHRGMIYDISVLKDVHSIGQFDIESMLWVGSQQQAEDRFGALDAYYEKQLKPIHGLDNENPYLLLNRLMNLCAKYDIPIIGNDLHKEMVEYLLIRIKEWEHPDHFHSVECQSAFYSTLLKALLRSRNRIEYATELRDVGIFEILLQECSTSEGFEKLVTALGAAMNKADLVRRLLEQFDNTEAERISRRLSTITTRTWDTEDQKTSTEYSRKTRELP